MKEDCARAKNKVNSIKPEAVFAWLLLLVSGSLISLGPVWAAADYKANVAKLDALLKVKPNDESAHYYRAVSLQYMGQYRAAKEDYDWVIKNGHNSGFRQYSQQSVLGLNRALFGSGIPVARRSSTAEAVPTKTAALTTVSQSGAKPQIYEFYIDSCPVCQKHDPEYSQLQSEVDRKIDFKRLNAEDPTNAALTSKYSVQHYPTFVFVDPSGNCVFNKAGGFPNFYLKQLIAQKFNL